MGCVTRKKNLGKSLCFKMPTLPKCMITTPSDFKLVLADYATEAALKTAIQNLILNPINSRGYMFPQFLTFENLSEAAIYNDSPLGVIPVRDGQYRFKFGVHKNLCTHRAMFTHRAVGEGRVFILDMDNNLWGVEDVATGDVRGFQISLIHTEKLMISDGSSPSISPVYVCLADNEELDGSGILLDASSLNTVERLTDVDIAAAGAIAAASFKVDVKQSCDETPVSGLLVADFLMYEDDGVTLQSIQTAVEDANVPGRYTLTATTAFVDGTLTLRAPSALTVKAYEVPEALEFDVP